MSKKKIVALVVLLVGSLGVGFVYREYWKGEFRSGCRNNLKLIGYALHEYSGAYGTLPPRVTRDAQGNLLHSWRTLLLPYVGEKSLYERIDLSKPWNDPANANAMAQHVSVYQCPASGDKSPTCHYLGIEGKDSVLADNVGVAFHEILDSRSRTLIAVESRQGISSWGEPVDAKEVEFQIDVNQPGANVSSRHSHGAFCVCSDGSVEYLPNGWKAQALREACTKSGFELAVMPSQLELTPEVELLQKFIDKGGPYRNVDLSKPSDPQVRDSDSDVEAMDWVQLIDQLSLPFVEVKIPASYAYFQKTGQGRYYLAVAHKQNEQMDAARYWFQEAALEEGLTLGEVNSARSLLVPFEGKSKVDEDLREQLNLLAFTVLRYWKQAERARPKLHLPKSYAPNQPIPLVVCLHPDRLSPAFWDDSFCNQLANQLQVAVLVPSATEHYGPDRYHWSTVSARQYVSDHATIEQALSEFANQFQEMHGQRLLVGFHESFDLVLTITGKHHDKYAGGMLVHPTTIGVNNDQTRAFIQLSKEQTTVKQRLFVLYEPEKYRENLANYIAKTLALTARHVELELDEEASFEYPNKLAADSELAPRILDALRTLLPAR